MPAAIPRIVVGLMVYNGSSTLRRVLNSLSRQTFSDCEIFISDDYSNDNSGNICMEYCRKDSRFKYFRQDKNIGLINNYRFVLDATTSEYFTWLGQDDFYENNDYLASLYACIQNGYDLVFPQIKKFHVKDGQIIELKRRPVKLDPAADDFKKHLYLMRKAYLGYQLIYGLSRREILRDINLWLRSCYIPGVPDEEPFLHFILSRYRYACVEDVFYVKDQTTSHYYRLSFARQFMPMVWDFIAVAGVLAQCNYTHWQKAQLMAVKFLRSAFTLGHILKKDIFHR